MYWLIITFVTIMTAAEISAAWGCLAASLAGRTAASRRAGMVDDVVTVVVSP